MFPYFFVLFLIIAFAIVDNKSKNDAMKIMMFVVLALFAGFRYNVGVDYIGYVGIFEGLDGKEIREPGGSFLVYLIKKIGGTEQLFFLIMAIITQLFIYKTFSRNKKWFWCSSFIYYCISLFYLASFNQVRQYAAMAVSIWALCFIDTGKPIKYFISILSAALFFHLTVIMFIPLYYFLKRSHSKWLYFSLIMVVVLISMYIDTIASLTPYDFYNKAERDIKVNDAQYLFALFSLFMLIYGYKLKKFHNNSVLFNMNSLCFYSLIMVTLQTSGMFIMMCQRINNYFILAYLLIIPAVLSSISKKDAAVCKIFIYLFCFLYFVRTIVFNGEHYKLVPYNVNFNLFNI